MSNQICTNKSIIQSISKYSKIQQKYVLLQNMIRCRGENIVMSGLELMNWLTIDFFIFTKKRFGYKSKLTIGRTVDESTKTVPTLPYCQPVRHNQKVRFVSCLAIAHQNLYSSRLAFLGTNVDVRFQHSLRVRLFNKAWATMLSI